MSVNSSARSSTATVNTTAVNHLHGQSFYRSPILTFDSSDPMSKVSPSTTPHISHEVASVPKKRILLVEDYPGNVLVASHFLEHFGYSFDVAVHGQEAVDKAKLGDYAAILMDVQMPGMDGFEATRLIREYEQHAGKPPTPIIGVTAYAMEGDRQRCMDMAMDDYISKPYEPEVLKEKLSRYCDIKRTAS